MIGARSDAPARPRLHALSGATPVSASDPSRYIGVEPSEGPKVHLCHRPGAGFYVLIEVAVPAEPAHRAHGDGQIGEAVPSLAGSVFGTGCSVAAAPVAP